MHAHTHTHAYPHAHARTLTETHSAHIPDFDKHCQIRIAHTAKLEDSIVNYSFPVAPRPPQHPCIRNGFINLETSADELKTKAYTAN